MTEPCTARIENNYSKEECVLEAGHEDPEYGTDHAGPRHPVTGHLRWNDGAVGAVPHQTTVRAATEATEEEGSPEVLRRRTEAAEKLLKQYVDLVAVTHRYPIAGGHDCLGENHSCSGFALARLAQELLEQYG